VGSALAQHINLEVLMQLKAAFHRADKDGGGDLSIDEFVVAFGDVGMASSIDDVKLRQLFTRIDANGREGAWAINTFCTWHHKNKMVPKRPLDETAPPRVLYAVHTESYTQRCQASISLKSSCSRDEDDPTTESANQPITA
jgi:hypothetical protein